MEDSVISPTAEYALRAIVALAQRPVGAMVTPEIAAITKVPPGYLAKVLQVLGRAGLVVSKRGLGGGFTLARPPEEISVLDVVNAIDPIRRIERCPLGIEDHGSQLCPLHRRVDDVIAAVEHCFAGSTIASLMGAPGWSSPLCQPAGSEERASASNPRPASVERGPGEGG